MRYAIISDIHSNLEALVAVLEEIAGLRADLIVCLGDLVGYGADPNRVMEVALEKKFQCIIGNHDQVACGITEPHYFNPHARQAALWTKEWLMQLNCRFLKGLPERIAIGDAAVAVHGSLEGVDEYILSAEAARDNFKIMKREKVRYCFFGHSHYQGSFLEAGGRLYMAVDKDLDLNVADRYLINPGSVGQPRDGDPRAAFAIYDEGAMVVSFHRVEYDVETASKKILAAGLSPFLAQRLHQGI